MRKVTCVILFLIVFETCAILNFSRAAKPASKRNVDDKEYQNQPMVVELLEEEYPDEYTNQESDISGQPIGRWRSTGKALEPKWRDGDSIPLVPFRTVTISSKPTTRKKQNSDDIDNPKNYASGQRSTHWQSQRQEKGTIVTNEYNYNTSEKPDQENNHPNTRGRETRLSRRRKPPQFEDLEQHQTTIKCINETKDLHEDDNQKKERKPLVRTPKLPHNTNDYLEGVALRYRETFQNYPSEYELNDEYQRPRSRKRRPPQNDDFIEYKSSTERITTRSHRKQENPRRNNLIRTNHNRTIKSPDKSAENSELKSLLKMQQVEGSSLSEILHRRNLTLSDLLQGRADVINLLKSKQAEDGSDEELNAKSNSVEMMKISASSTITATSDKTPSQPSSKPPIPFRNFAKKTDDSSFRAVSTNAFRQVLPTQEVRPKIRPTESMNSVKITVSSETPMVDTTTEIANLPETDKIKIVYDEDEIMEFSDFSGKNSNSKAEKSETINSDNSNQDPESTLSIEHLLSPTIQPEMNPSESVDKFLEQSRERIQLENKIPHSERDDVSAETDSFEIEYQSDGPFSGNRKMFTNSDAGDSYEEDDSTIREQQERVFEKTKKEIVDDSHKNHRNDDIYFEMEPDARAEILELFHSGNSAAKLQSLLKARNMSLDDLIALRQRGSSQVHFAQASLDTENNFKPPSKDPDNHETRENDETVKIAKPDCPPSQVKEFIEWMKEKGKEPEKEILHIKEFETLPPIWSDRFGNSQETRKAENDIEKLNFETGKETDLKTDSGTESDAHREMNFETNHSDNSDDFMDILSHFKTSRPNNDDDEDSEGISFYASNDEVPSSNLPGRRNNSVIPVEDGRVREIVSDISNTFNNIFRLNTNEGIGEGKHSISRVRTSIIVSGAILGVTIVVFLGIFIVCRVRQKKKYTYNNTFSRAVFQSPVLTARKLSNTSSLNTIMVNVVATSTTKRPEKAGYPETDDDFDIKSEIEHDSLDANDSWETIPDFMK